MDTVERHIARLKVAIERHDDAVEQAREIFRRSIGLGKEEYERACVFSARRILGPDRSTAISSGKNGKLALMSAAKGRTEYDDVEKTASDKFSAEMLKVELARDDAIATANKKFLLEEEEIRKSTMA